MKTLSYKEQLAHPNWQRRRLEMLSASGWKCAHCGGDEQQLHVHHRRYVKGRMAWEYGDGDLTVLCAGCHEEEHDRLEELNSLLCRVPAKSALDALHGWTENAGLNGETAPQLGGIAALIASLLSVDDARKVLDLAMDLYQAQKNA
jgi:hypothetical protein